MLDPNYDFRGLPHADKKPEVKINPARKNRYEVTVNIKDAPGGFASVEGVESYYAPNCKYTTNRMMGATSNPSFDQKIPLKKVGDMAYMGVFYTDSPLNEDYYGQGVCKWENIGISVRLRATVTDKRDTIFSVFIDYKALEKFSKDDINGNKTTAFFRKNYYPWPTSYDENHLGFLTRGIKKEDIEKRNLELKDFFALELVIRRV